MLRKTESSGVKQADWLEGPSYNLDCKEGRPGCFAGTGGGGKNLGSGSKFEGRDGGVCGNDRM